MRSGGLGNDLRLTDFAAGRGRMKPEHEAAVRQLIKDFDLFEPDSAFEVEFVRGFTDPVDAEEKNVILREDGPPTCRSSCAPMRFLERPKVRPPPKGPTTPDATRLPAPMPARS